MEAVAHQGDGGGGVGQRGDVLAGLLAEAAQQRPGEAGVQRHHLQLVADRAVHAAGEGELVRVQRLGRAVVGGDLPVVAAEGEAGDVQEGALAHPAVRVRHLRAQQQRRGLDAAAGGDDGGRFQGHGGAGGVAVVVQGRHLHGADPGAVVHQLVGAGAVDQGGAGVHGGGQRGHQHRLLGVGGAAHAAVADIPAAAHVSRNHRPVPAECFAAAFDHVVVGVGGHRPGLDAELLFHALEIGVQVRAAGVVDAEALTPVVEGFLGRAEAGGPVDHRGAAHGAALQNGDGAVLGGAHGALLVQLPVGVAFIEIEIPGAGEAPGLHQDHLEAGGAEYFRAHPAAGAGADDHHVRFQGAVVADGGAVDQVPFFPGVVPGVGDILNLKCGQVLHDPAPYCFVRGTGAVRRWRCRTRPRAGRGNRWSGPLPE